MATTPISNAPRETPELGLSTNDPVSPTSTRFENGKLLFGGFEVTGVDINKLERGKLSVSMPLNPGDYELPGEYDITRVEVPKNCVLQVDLLIEKNESGQPSIKIGEAVFSEPFVIKNPTGALSPTATKYPWLNWILDILKDFLANFHIERIGLDDDDFLRVHGHAKVAGVANLDQKEAIKKLNEPDIDPKNPTVETVRFVIKQSGDILPVGGDCPFFEGDAERQREEFLKWDGLTPYFEDEDRPETLQYFWIDATQTLARREDIESEEEEVNTN